MNTYLIQQQVRTPIHLIRPMTYRTFILEPVAPDLGGGFLAKREVTAVDGVTAHRAFSLELSSILDAASVVTQCAVSALSFGSYCVYRLNANPEHLFYYHHAEEVEAVGMMLDEQELRDVERVLVAVEQSDSVRTGFGYLRQANLASSPTFFLSMLIIACEAFAGQATVTGSCSQCDYRYEYPGTNKVGLRAILGDDLYRDIYGTGRLRNRLIHGGRTNEAIVADVATRTYCRLLAHLKHDLELEGVDEIIGAPRSTTYEYFRTFMQVEAGPPELLMLERDHTRVTAVSAPPSY